VAAHAFHPEPVANDLAHALVSDFLDRSPAASALAQHLLAATGSRFRDALDVLSGGASDGSTAACSSRARESLTQSIEPRLYLVTRLILDISDGKIASGK
jgi:hypothetical protein